MLIITKSYQFCYSNRKTIKSPEFILEPKFDGASICITYKNGELISAPPEGMV